MLNDLSRRFFSDALEERTGEGLDQTFLIFDLLNGFHFKLMTVIGIFHVFAGQLVGEFLLDLRHVADGDDLISFLGNVKIGYNVAAFSSESYLSKGTSDLHLYSQ